MIKENKIKRRYVISTKLTYKELQLFKSWKKENKISTTSIAIRKALAIAMNHEEEL